MERVSSWFFYAESRRGDRRAAKFRQSVSHADRGFVKTEIAEHAEQ